MRGFTSPAHAQRFLHVHGVIQNLFRVGHHRLRSVTGVCSTRLGQATRFT